MGKEVYKRGYRLHGNEVVSVEVVIVVVVMAVINREKKDGARCR